MAPKVQTIFSQDLDNGTTGEFGIGEDGQAYWNGKPIVTEEKVVLQLWVNIALIVTAIAVVGQMLFAGLAYVDSHMTAQKSVDSAGLSVTARADPEVQEVLLPLSSGYVCDAPGQMAYSTKEGTLACIDGKWKHSSKCIKDGQTTFAGEVRLVCQARKWTPPL